MQYYLNPWWREERTYFTELSVEDCRRLLRESTTRFLARSVGRSLFSVADFTLYRVSFLSNGFKPYVYVALSDAPAGGTLVKLKFSATLSTQLFIGGWFGFLALWLVVGAISVVRENGVSWWALLFGLGFAAFGLGINAFGRLIAAGDPAFLEAFLQDLLALREPPAWAIAVA